MNPTNPSMRGVGLVLAAALLWGTTGTAQSFAPPSLPSVWVGALRLVVAGLFFAAWLLLIDRRRPRGLPWPGIVAAAVCMTVYNLAFFAGVRATGVAVGTAIAIGSGPVWAGLLQAVVSRSAPGALWWAGTVLAVGGGALMIAGAGAAQPLSVVGIVLCLVTGLSYAVYALINKSMVARAEPGAVSGAVFVISALLALPIAAVLAGTPMLAARDVAIVAWLGVMSTGVAYLLFSHGLRHISGATGVALALGEPVTAFLLALVVVGERPGAWAFVGLLGVLAGLAVVIRAELVAK